jgi:hypothetical protein
VRIAATLFGTVLLVGAVPAAASAACPSSPSTAALAQYGDNAAYSLLSGSSFESGAPGWSLTNAEIVSGAGASEEGANGDSYSLEIEPNGVAVSPQFCVSSEYPSFRFFARQTSGGGWGSSLKVSLRWTTGHGFTLTTPVASLQPTSSWTLSPVLKLAGSLPLWMPGSTLKVRLVFQPSGDGSWAIDDVYLDPYSR